LEEGVVDDVVLSIVAFDDPVTATHVTPLQIGNDSSRLCALSGFTSSGLRVQKVFMEAPSMLNTDRNHSSSQPIKTA
jgi:hypothetical protein